MLSHSSGFLNKFSANQPIYNSGVFTFSVIISGSNESLNAKSVSK